MKGDCFCSESADNTEPGCPYIQNRHHEGSHSVSEVSADISKTFRSGCYQSRNGDSDRDPSLVRGGFLRIDRAGFSQGLRVLFHGLLQDRKSTRLNSSHVAISYAVFCLKKKT